MADDFPWYYGDICRYSFDETRPAPPPPTLPPRDYVDSPEDDDDEECASEEDASLRAEASTQLTPRTTRDWRIGSSAPDRLVAGWADPQAPPLRPMVRLEPFREINIRWDSWEPVEDVWYEEGDHYSNAYFELQERIADEKARERRRIRAALEAERLAREAEYPPAEPAEPIEGWVGWGSSWSTCRNNDNDGNVEDEEPEENPGRDSEDVADDDEEEEEEEDEEDWPRAKRARIV
ncbi:hypothetical protein ANO11243_055520 [Dothideomycetidae sp. 11243]|nr:hypothetical protein ANO11243_055520 [fungal sp. No.11243]